MALFDFLKRTDTNLNSMTARSSQLLRLRQDVQTWRDAIKEAEQAQFPHRVRMQRVFVDTVLNGHVWACMQKRKDLTMLRDIEVYNVDGTENEDLEELFESEWFTDFLSYALDTIFYGYSLISLGDVVDGKFKNIDVIKRWHISPDRLNVTPFQYSLTGYNFLQPPYDMWHVWATTPSENGQSNVGYGLLYKCAIYEIINRNLLGFNANAAELFGQPIRKGRTNKTEENERGEFAQALANMGSSGWIMLDQLDEVELIENNTGGQGYKIYENLEARNEKKISKLILGHADALDSTAGKLGSDANGSAVQALKAIQTADGRFVTNLINSQLIPKMRQIGFDLPEGIYFEFSDNEMEQEEEAMELDRQLKVANLALKLKQAGLSVLPEWVTEKTEIPVEIAKGANVPPAMAQNVIESLRNLYK